MGGETGHTGGPLRLGYDEAGKGPPLVLVHGFPFDRRMWVHQLEGLAEFRRVVAVDLRGRGLSPHPAGAGWTIDDHAADVAQTIEALGAGPVDVGGLSMGGYVLFALLRRHPELVRSAVLMGTRATADSPEARTRRDEQAARARAEGTEALADSFLPMVLAPGTGEDVRATVRRMIADTPGDTAAADLAALRDRPDSTPDLASIDVSTLVLHGDEDRVVPVDEARATAKAIPGAQFSAVPGAGHLAPFENPTDANVDLQLFLARVSAG
jgi:pimeloyl-ACP methyl ester carboxylesterase